MTGKPPNKLDDSKARKSPSDTDSAPETDSNTGALDTVKGLGGVFARFMEWLNTTRLMRSYLRYGNAKSNLLAGGIAYTALFSMAGIVTLGIMAAHVFFASDPDSGDQFYEVLNSWLPGAIKTESSPGLIDPNTISAPGFTWGTLVILVVSLLAGIRVVASLRISVQTVFGSAQRPGAGWKNALRDLFMFLILGLSFLLSAAFSSGSIVLLRLLHDKVPFPLPFSPTLNILAFLVTTAILTAVLMFTLRFLALVRVPRRDLWIGTLTLGALATAAQMSGTYLAVSVPPAYATFTTLLTVILWVNILARLFLYMACWIANPPAVPPPTEEFPHFKERPNFVTVSAPHTLSWPHDPISGQLWSITQEEDAWRLSQRAAWNQQQSDKKGVTPPKGLWRGQPAPLSHHYRKASGRNNEGNHD